LYKYFTCPSYNCPGGKPEELVHYELYDPDWENKEYISKIWRSRQPAYGCRIIIRAQDNINGKINVEL